MTAGHPPFPSNRQGLPDSPELKAWLARREGRRELFIAFLVVVVFVLAFWLAAQ